MHAGRLIFILSALLISVGGVADAQIISAPRPSLADQWTFGFSLLGGIPVGEFRNHENGGGGGEVSVGFQPIRQQPLVLRFSGGGMQYGNLKGYGFQEVCDDPDNPFNCYTDEVEYNARSHNMWYAQAGPEITAIAGAWRPFAFAMAGWTGFYSRANIKPTTPGGEEWSQGLHSSTNFSTAYGVGIRRVWDAGGRAMGIEVSPRVTRNAKASYLSEEGMIRNSDGSWTAVPREGAANVLGIYLGFYVGPRSRWSTR
ncbi:MAG TPA: hypothetical protein VEB19_12420 [Gemmatimonadaceae bacterium]|nr:hypothetical protein [Gemmatimonadaceae bacterium]